MCLAWKASKLRRVENCEMSQPATGDATFVEQELGRQCKFLVFRVQTENLFMNL